MKFPDEFETDQEFLEDTGQTGENSGIRVKKEGEGKKGEEGESPSPSSREFYKPEPQWLQALQEGRQPKSPAPRIRNSSPPPESAVSVNSALPGRLLIGTPTPRTPAPYARTVPKGQCVEETVVRTPVPKEPRKPVLKRQLSDLELVIKNCAEQALGIGETRLYFVDCARNKNLIAVPHSDEHFGVVIKHRGESTTCQVQYVGRRPVRPADKLGKEAKLILSLATTLYAGRLPVPSADLRHDLVALCSQYKQTMANYSSIPACDVRFGLRFAEMSVSRKAKGWANKPKLIVAIEFIEDEDPCFAGMEFMERNMFKGTVVGYRDKSNRLLMYEIHPPMTLRKTPDGIEGFYRKVLPENTPNIMQYVEK
ncbi:hypothetical protein KY362_08370 [Candidatus Woesearchaeota archaeon]|nr:hypothetical protein [Candidatus Woesearchaeota archaeon]